MADDKAEAKEGKGDKRPQLSLEQKVFKYNLGAAYGVATGDIFNGMYLSLQNNNSVMEEPLIRRAFEGYQAIEQVSSGYQKALKDWENGGKQGDKPVLPSSEALDGAKRGYEDLIFSANERASMFANAYSSMNVGTAVNSIFYGGKLPRGVPKEISDMIGKNSEKITGKVDGVLKNTMQNILEYHIIGDGTRDVQRMLLEKSLEAIASGLTKKQP